MRLAGNDIRIIAAMTCTVMALAAAPAAAGPTAGYGEPSGSAVDARAVLQTVAIPTSGPTAAAGDQAGPHQGTGSRQGAKTRPDVGTAVPRRATRPFSLVGATWTDPDAALGGAIEVRTRRTTDGRWSDWRLLEVDAASAPDPAAGRGTPRGSTDPLWVGESDGIEARVVLPAPARTTLPRGLRLDLVDPDATLTARAGRSTAAATAIAPDPAASDPSAATASDQAPAGGITAAAGVAAVEVPARPVPAVISRARWGADESIVREPAAYTTDVQALFVHHTAGTNDYDCEESARILRGIQAYHVRSKGWNDIGYNFLVDRCGTLFEGRGGGITRPVLGAHTLGFNGRSAAIAVIGEHGDREIGARVSRVIAQVAAYKIGMYGNDPTSRVTLTSTGSGKYPHGEQVRLDRVSGHRDAVPTACPGNALYAQLPRIRSLAGGPVAALAVSRLAGSARVGSTFYTRGAVTASWSTRTATTLIHRFDLLVDGLVAASVPAGHRSATLRLGPGRHSVRLRGVHLSGRLVSTRAFAFVVDATAPVFTAAPTIGLRAGTVGGTVPVTLGWQVADPGGLHTVRLTRPIAAELGTARTRWPTTAPAGVVTTWQLNAADRAGNATTAQTTGRPVVVSDAAAARTGTWAAVRDPDLLGGAARRSTTADSTLTWTFTGRAVGLTFSRSPRSGQAVVSVDGQPVDTVDLQATATAHRQVAWTYSWGTPGAHTVSIRVVGTAGRPGVLNDGLVYLP